MKLFKNLFIIITLAINFITLSGCDKSDSKAPEDALAVRPEDHISGNPNAKVTLIEYSDFQCPACGQAHPIIKQAREDLAESIKFVYRHFPLAYHYQAIPAARAAEAAGKQGKFFEMHDLLFEKQEEWSDSASAKEIFTGYAETLGLDIKKFTADYDAKSTLDRIESDRDDDEMLDILGTPTIYMNGKKIPLQAYPDFKKSIEAEIANPSFPKSSTEGIQPL